MFASKGTILMYADDVFRRQAAFVIALRGDPNITFFVLDGDVSAGGGRQPAVINAAHDGCNLFRRGLREKPHV